MSPTRPLRIAAMLIVTASSANAQFSGPYAAETWTVTGAGLGPSAAEFAADGSNLTITGPDGVAGAIDVTHAVIEGGAWSFDWSYVITESCGFDDAYYLINGEAIYLLTTCGSFDNGSVSVEVNSGDIIGWRVTSVDGIFGPAVFTVTNFQIPAPGVLALFGLVGVARDRRRHVEIHGHP